MIRMPGIFRPAFPPVAIGPHRSGTWFACVPQGETRTSRFATPAMAGQERNWCADVSARSSSCRAAFRRDSSRWCSSPCSGWRATQRSGGKASRSISPALKRRSTSRRQAHGSSDFGPVPQLVVAAEQVVEQPLALLRIVEETWHIAHNMNCILVRRHVETRAVRQVHSSGSAWPLSPWPSFSPSLHRRQVRTSHLSVARKVPHRIAMKTKYPRACPSSESHSQSRSRHTTAVMRKTPQIRMFGAAFTIAPSTPPSVARRCHASALRASERQPRHIGRPLCQAVAFLPQGNS
jgi:hypothetical protein